GVLSVRGCDKHCRQTQKQGAHSWHVPFRRVADSSPLIYPVEWPSASRPDIRKKCSAVCFDDEVSRRQQRVLGVNTWPRRPTSPVAGQGRKSTANPKTAA